MKKEAEKIVDKVIDPILKAYFSKMKSNRKTIAQDKKDGKEAF